MIDQEKIHDQCINNSSEERIKALEKLEFDFLLLPDKQKAWNQLIKLTGDKDSSVRFKATSILCSVFSHVPDKETAWNDLLILTKSGPFVPIFSRLMDRNSKYVDIRKKAAETLVSSFSHMPDKQKAWNQLIKLTVRLTSDKECQFKDSIDFLGFAFPYVADKEKAWDDLHKLTNDKDWHVKSTVASTIGSIFSKLPEKQQAWGDLYRLMNDDSYLLRPAAATALGAAFPYVPEKQKAFDDLIKLTNSENSDVRRGAASALGFAFSYVPDKQKLWNVLTELSNDQNRNVRNYANHSLGKICIFQASQAEKENNYKNELERAIEFFEKASQESDPWSNPSQFCLPFYRSFHTIVFERQQARDEINKYLVEAKDAVKGSKSKELLFEAVDNLANAVKDIQSLENLDLNAKKRELNFYRKYCDRAAELMMNIEEKVPFAAMTVKKGLPILDRNLKWLIEEIQEEAEAACSESQGTATEGIACSVRKEVQKWEINSQEEMSWHVENLIFTLESTIPRTPKNHNFFDRISQIIKEKDIVKQYEIVCTIIPLIPSVSMDEKINNMEQGIDDVKKCVRIVNENTTIIIEKLDEIQEELKKGFENLDKLSIKVGGTEGECLKIFSEKLFEITKKGDSETLKHFLEEVLKNEDALTREIESASAPHKEKEEAKGSISKLKFLLKKAKNPAKEFGKNVANEIVVSYTAKGIIELFLPMMSMAIFGVPIPSQIVDILTNLKN